MIINFQIKILLNRSHCILYGEIDHLQRFQLLPKNRLFNAGQAL